jgi:hypothetical protein
LAWSAIGVASAKVLTLVEIGVAARFRRIKSSRTSAPIEQVSELLQEIAESTVLPKFRNLAEDEVEEKSRGEIVTAVDRKAEELLSPKLLSLLPGSRVVGEEATAKNPALLDELDQGLIWLVDPIDGTSKGWLRGCRLSRPDCRPMALHSVLAHLALGSCARNLARHRSGSQGGTLGWFGFQGSCVASRTSDRARRRALG